MATPRARIDASTRATPTSSSQAARTPSSNTMGRLELVSWLNHALRSDYASVQECGDGVAYCQLLDALHPGAVPLHRLDFNARYLADNERNVRVLSQTMRSLGLPVDVDYEALASGKFIVRVEASIDETRRGSVILVYIETANVREREREKARGLTTRRRGASIFRFGARRKITTCCDGFIRTSRRTVWGR